MFYKIIEEINGDIFEEAYNTKEEAEKMMQLEYANLSDHDKKRRKAVYILETETIDDIDGNIIERII